MLLSIEMGLMLVVLGSAAMLLQSGARQPARVLCAVRRSGMKRDRAA